MRSSKPFLVVVFALVAGVLSSQTGSTKDDPVFRVTANLVQVDAVVTDSKGKQVTNLGAGDFEIIADGVPQPITRFSYVSLDSSHPGPVSPQSALRLPASAALPDPALRRQDVRRTIVLMIDDLGLSFEGMAFVRDSLLKFIDEQLQPGDLVAICRTSAGSGAFQQFTSDRRLARSVISSLRWKPNGFFVSSFADNPGPASFAATPTVNINPSNAPPTAATRDVDLLRRNTLALGALGAIDYAVQGLRDMPGRKSVILFSDGFRLDPMDDSSLGAFHRLIDRANRSATVIYTMHVPGLRTGLPSMARNPLSGVGPDGPEGLLDSLAFSFSSGERVAQEGLELLARSTGGLAYTNRNDLNYGLDLILEDQKGYYLLGYVPPHGTFNAAGGTLPYHRLQVVMKDKRWHVRSRTGFFGASDEETSPTPLNPAEAIRAAMLSPFTSSDIQLRLSSFYADVPGRGPGVRALLDIDPSGLTFTPQLDGSQLANIKLVVAAYGTDNRQIAQLENDYKVHLPAAKMAETLRNGLVYELPVVLPKPGGFHIRAAVRDLVTGKTGSANEFIQIPDLRKEQFALTSVVLAPVVSAEQGASFVPSATKRKFQRGDLLQYVCLLESRNVKTAARVNASGIAAQIRVVREGRQIYLGSGRLTDLAGGQRAITGQLKLGTSLPDGDYFLQVVASLSKGRKTLNEGQWTDFEVVR